MSYTPKFHRCFQAVIGHEGRFQNSPHDPGNWLDGKLIGTMWGLCARDYGHEVDIPTATLADAQRIYHRDFYRRANGDQLPNGITYATFDAAINTGLGNGIRFLQRAAGTVDDGIIGPATRAAVDRKTRGVEAIDDFLREYHAQRAKYYSELRTVDTFGLGWYRRVLEVHDRAQEWARIEDGIAVHPDTRTA